jgi:hypothetical protein
VGALVVFDNVRGHTSQGACPIADHGAGSLGSPQPPPAGPETWGASLSGTPATDGQYVLQVWVRYLHRVPFGG